MGASLSEDLGFRVNIIRAFPNDHLRGDVRLLAVSSLRAGCTCRLGVENAVDGVIIESGEHLYAAYRSILATVHRERWQCSTELLWSRYFFPANFLRIQ
ncbi:MAG: hypothetical protein KDA52_07170 [Planctomycetaceae bacterium]|nr:hypothetical protein [Planctomycetaceae bacterium]